MIPSCTYVSTSFLSPSSSHNSSLLASLGDEEDWEDDDEPPMELHSSEQYSFDPPEINSRLMERADDFLLADDPALFSDEFSDPDEWDMS